jgi:polysaccharide export outer membrane protein
MIVSIGFAMEHVTRAAREAILAVGIVAVGGSHGSAATQERAAPPAARESTPLYLIGPADVLRIVVWKEPDLTRDVTVRPDGMITVPLLGDLPAAGRAPSQLAAALAQELKRYIGDPRVVVVVTEARSARFFVVGQVTKSGEFPLSGHTTVLQGLALAGGFKDYAKLKDIVVVKRDGTVLPFNFDRVADGKDVSQNFALESGDTIVVP